ncbi:gluzincin family metallopeptidase [Tautonia plasticadhaerens]|uniref:Peptidase M4 domain-containing protein n=1 Tax=Tautonia plasticadhaerens TaxID=2527974 RepID=A0A518HCB2_9BACT|nr:hypothetical protein [Tautonia plasticadhaerens]QDV38296.1 hypothetical protein ElP_62470 [Tautonia plasticadhaerens]
MSTRPGLPPATGTKRMGMFLDDPSLPDLIGDYEFPLETDFLVGMNSSKFHLLDTSEVGLPVFPGLDWSAEADLSFESFRRKGEVVDNPQFHQVNAFAVAAHTLALVEEALGQEIAWKHGGPLVIRPHAFQGQNAFYDSGSPSINFGFFTSPFQRTPIWTCLSHDIVAHELGHAILDSFRPQFLFSLHVDTGAIHESMGDLLALFSALEHKPVVERLFRDSGGDLRRPSTISNLAEQFGIGLGGVGMPSLRSALQGPPYPEAGFEVHDRSTTWTAAIYEILIRLVETIIPPRTNLVASRAELESPGDRTFDEFSEAVVTASYWTKGLLIRAFPYMTPTSVTMPGLARMMVFADERAFPDEPAHRDIAREVFERRGIWDPSLDLDPPSPGIGPAFEGFDRAGPTARHRMVRDHADALRIPMNLGATLLTPRMVTLSRTVEGAREGKSAGYSATITERYLYYSYEVQIDFGGFLFRVVGGGMLAMDEDYRDLLLVTDPELRGPSLAGTDPIGAAFSDVLRRFRETNHQALDGLRRGDGAPHPPASPFPYRLLTPEVGAPRLVRARCNLREHLEGIVGSRSLFPFRTAPDASPSASPGRGETASGSPDIARIVRSAREAEPDRGPSLVPGL